MNDISGLHTHSFQNRLKVSDIYTKLLVTSLSLKGHFKQVRKATYEEEMEGIDWWVTFPGETDLSPIQFKLRDKRLDVPVVRFQPFWGHGHERTVEGRDYRGVMKKSSRFYYVAIRNSEGLFSCVYRCNSARLLDEVKALDQEWIAATPEIQSNPRNRGGVYNSEFFTTGLVDRWLAMGIRNKPVFISSTGSQVWWKKNDNEGSPKLNMYISHRIRDFTQELNENEGRQLKRLAGKFLSGAATFFD